MRIFPFLKPTILSLTIFLFPLFFLHTTQEYFATNKLYLLALAAFLLLATSLFEIILTKKIIFYKNPADILTIIFLLSVSLSLVLASTNKIQAVLNTNFGLLAIFSLVVISFYLRNSNLNITGIISITSVILSIIAIFYFFQPTYSSPIGSQIDLALFLGFCLIFQLIQTGEKSIFNQIAFAFTITAFILAVMSGISELANFPPLLYSLYAALKIFKNPLNALLGVGLDNYSSIFTKVKDAAYNQSKFWQVGSFNFGRSALLQVLTESGLLGLISFLLLFVFLFKQSVKKNKSMLLLATYLTTVFLLSPPSLTLFFILFLALSLAPTGWKYPAGVVSIDLKQKPFFYAVPVVMILFLTLSSYLLGRAYLAEYYFKNSLDGLSKKIAKDIYDNQRRAIVLNPFIERFRIGFSQANMIIANNIAAKAKTSEVKEDPPAGGDGETSGVKKLSVNELSPQDRQTITQAIKAAIEEAKAAITLNEQKATNWENLALVYRNLINTAEAADTWAISSYHRAIVLDQQNAKYRLELGGIYYLLKNYDEAARYFEQATTLKPDWANANYNLAWALFQKKDYEKAISEMQTVINLLDPQKDSLDLEKAKKDLEEFKIMIAQ